MENIELIYQLTKALDFDNNERINLIKILWTDYIVCQDWGYGANQQIEDMILKQLTILENILQDNK